MSNVTLALSDDEGNLVTTISGTFDDSDIKVLRQFVDAMARVRGSTLLQRGLPAITNMKMASEVFQITCKSYTDSELFELLHVLRHVILSEETTSFEKVSGLLGRRFLNKNFSKHLKALRRMFEHGKLNSYMKITVEGQDLFDKSLLHIWLNGTQYHTDSEKAEAWKKLEGTLKTENARALVMNQLYSKVKALFFLEHIVTLILERHVTP